MKNNQELVNINILKSLEPDIRKLLKRADVWKTLDVDYYPPRVERLYTTFDRKEANTLVLSELSEERKLEILLLFENYMRVRTEYICGVCGQSHKTEELANTCENTHIRIQPTNWWLIPFIGLFLIIFYSFKSDRYHIKYEEKSIMTSLKRDWIFLSPMLTMIITILILITLSHYGKS